MIRLCVFAALPVRELYSAQNSDSASPVMNLVTTFLNTSDLNCVYSASNDQLNEFTHTAHLESYRSDNIIVGHDSKMNYIDDMNDTGGLLV